MSIVLVTFPGVLQPSVEAIQQEAELEALLERRITGNNTYKFLRHISFQGHPSFLAKGHN